MWLPSTIFWWHSSPFYVCSHILDYCHSSIWWGTYYSRRANTWRFLTFIGHLTFKPNLTTKKISTSTTTLNNSFFRKKTKKNVIPFVLWGSAHYLCGLVSTPFFFVFSFNFIGDYSCKKPRWIQNIWELSFSLPLSLSLYIYIHVRNATSF